MLRKALDTSLSSCRALVVAAGLLPAISFAQTTSTNSVLSTSSLPQAETEARTSKAKAQGALRYEFTQYTTGSDADPRLNRSSLTQADFKFDFETTSTLSRIDVTGGKYWGLNNSFFSVQELFSGVQFRSIETQVSVGRKKEFWSSADQDWDLGLWQPKQNVDPLRPIDQGLTGLFVNSQVGEIEVLAYGSPIFIPTMNPSIAEKEGSLVSESRWYQEPADRGTVLGKDTKLVYKLDIPEIKELVMNPGAGARVMYNKKNPGFWASANMARKPINSLFVKYNSDLNPTQSNPKGESVVTPTVNYHRLYGADMGWRFEKAVVSVSYLRDDPEVVRPTDDMDDNGQLKTQWFRSAPGALQIWTAHAERPIEIPQFRDPVVVSLDYLNAREEITKDIDSTGAVRGHLFPHRLMFTNAASIKGKFSTVLQSRSLVTTLRYLREFDQNGSLWSLMAQYSVTRAIVAHAGVDILGVDQSDAGNSDPRFLNQFRTNDRVFGGMSYVF